MLTYLGFSDVEIRRFNPYPEEAKVPGDDPLTARVNGHLCGPQDFAVVGRKAAPATENAPLETNAPAQEHAGDFADATLAPIANGGADFYMKAWRKPCANAAEVELLRLPFRFSPESDIRHGGVQTPSLSAPTASPSTAPSATGFPPGALPT